MKEFIEELKHNQNINFEKGLENRINIDYVIERLEDIQKNTNISKLYNIVFEDIVRGYIKDKECDRDMTLNISETSIKQIAKDLIYNNDNLWDNIKEIIDWQLRDYTFYNDDEEGK